MESITPEALIEQLRLAPHPEGGFFRETFRDSDQITNSSLPSRFIKGDRSFSTAIYYLLRSGDVSRLHRLKSSEVWHFYLGAPLTIVEWSEDNTLRETVLGSDLIAGQTVQHVVSHGVWFGARIVDSSDSFSLVGCTVAPGFDFQDFEFLTPSLHQELSKNSKLSPFL